MIPAVRNSFVIFFALSLGVVGLLWEHSRTSRIAAEVQSLRRKQAEIALLNAEKTRLLAAQVSAEELGLLRRDHEEIEKLRASLLRLGKKAVADELARRARVNTQSRKSFPEKISLPDDPFGTYAGNQTPKATLDSVIWGAKSGNIDALAALIAFDPAGRAKATDLFGRLPADVRAEYGTPEKVYATLIAANLPLSLSEALVTSESIDRPDRTTLALRLEQRKDVWHAAQFTFVRDGSAWKLVVPDHIVEQYGTEL